MIATKQIRKNEKLDSGRNVDEKSAQRDAYTARALAVVRFGHRPARHKHTNTQTGPITIHFATS